jgi:hypothetical protein
MSGCHEISFHVSRPAFHKRVRLSCIGMLRASRNGVSVQATWTDRREPTPASSRWPWCNPATFYIYVHLDQTRAAPLQPLSDRSTKKPAKLELTNLRLVEPGKSRQAIRTNRGSPKTHGTIRWRCCKTNWLVRIGVFGRIRWMRGRARNTSRVLPTPRVTPELFSLG